MTMLVASSELVGFLGVAETWKSVGWALAVHFHFHRAFAFGAGFAKDGESGQSFVVNLSNQIGFAGIFLRRRGERQSIRRRGCRGRSARYRANGKGKAAIGST
jgi:hypothetical protein